MSTGTTMTAMSIEKGMTAMMMTAMSTDADDTRTTIKVRKVKNSKKNRAPTPLFAFSSFRGRGDHFGRPGIFFLSLCKNSSKKGDKPGRPA
ncbi:MAG: hypothetical protein D3903_18560 [Candidatus Electrothrix sp. GM3_4]|nr:hypothetical protein [Candidatus Electrothrix sp. GM3_4]